MIQHREHPRLALESAETFWIRCEDRRQHLDRHVTPKLGVTCAVDSAHRTRAEQRLNRVRAELSSDQGRRRVVSDEACRRSQRSSAKDMVHNSFPGKQRFDYPA